MVCFVHWCRLNTAELVTDPVVARRVLEAYASIPDPTPMRDALEAMAPDTLLADADRIRRERWAEARD